MMHPLFIQFNEDLGDRLNQCRPSQDYETFGDIVIEKIAGLVSAYGTCEHPQAYADAVAQRLFLNVLP